MEKTLSFLETYKGRDMILRFLAYFSKCIAGSLNSEELAFHFNEFSTQLSSSRACFRLLDGFPTVVQVWRASIEKKDHKNIDEKLIDVLENIVDLIFCPLDSLSWAEYHRIIKPPTTLWDTAGTYCWVLSLYLGIIKVLKKLSKISIQKGAFKHVKSNSVAVKNQSKEVWNLKMTFARYVIDLLFAVNYLPRGVLWAQFLNQRQVGFLGTVSSLICIYQTLKMKY